MSFGRDMASGVAMQMLLPLAVLLGVGVGIGIGVSWIPTLAMYLAHHLVWQP